MSKGQANDALEGLRESLSDKSIVMSFWYASGK